MNSGIDLLAESASSKGLTMVAYELGVYLLPRGEEDMTSRFLHTRDVFTLTTKDLPLPSAGLLEMQ